MRSLNALGLAVLVAVSMGVVVSAAAAAGADHDRTTLDRLEAAVTAAKAEYRLHPGEDSLAAVEQAVTALEQELGAATRQPDAQATEVEPNDSAATATVLVSGDYGTGDLSPAGDVDFWSSAGAAVGDLVFVQTDTGESTTGADTTLNVLADDGTTVIEFDDDDGGPLESAVAGAPVPQAGSVYFEVHEFGDNFEVTPYHITVVVVDPATAVAETEPNDTAATATPITGAMMTGELAVGAVDVDFYSFSAAAGDRLCVIMDDDPDNDSTLTNTEIDILDTDGTTVLLAGDNGATANANAAGTVVVGTAGTYYLRVQDGGSGDTEYTFVVTTNGTAVPVELQSLHVE